MASNVSTPSTSLLEQHIAYIEKLVAQGGPTPDQYGAFREWLGHIAKEYRSETLTEDDLATLRGAFGEALTKSTLQGFCLQKPHGHAGDFEIIDRLYTKHITDDEEYQRWDMFLQARPAVEAVRNRKTYFIRLIEALTEAYPDRDPLPVLNLASGPARDVLEFFQANSSRAVRFECIDNDADAIEYARDLCAPYLDWIAFHETNALRYTTDSRFQLIWSAGLFDYLSDKGFEFLLEHMLDLLRDDGELVVGNFSPRNPSRNYMEVVTDWHLHYRTKQKLVDLALQCGVDEKDVRVGCEPEGINYFLHIKRGGDFIPMDAL
jgi:SAM-dependent methyltransferase